MQKKTPNKCRERHLLLRVWSGAGSNVSEVINTAHMIWVAFRHWNNFPLASDLATLSHHRYPDKFLLVSLPTSCFHFFPPSFLHSPGTGKEVIRLQRLREGFLPWDSNACSCKAGGCQSLQLCSAEVWCANVGITERAAAEVVIIILNPFHFSPAAPVPAGTSRRSSL